MRGDRRIATAALAASTGLLLLGIPPGAATPSPAPVPSLVAEPVDLGTLGGEEGRAQAVDGDLVVGSAQTARGRWHAFLVDLGDPDPVMEDLGTLGGRSSGATDVSNGLVVGVAQGPSSGWRNFLYDSTDPSAEMIDLGPVSGGSTYGDPSGPFVEDGLVAGQTGRNGHTRAFSYDTTAADPRVRAYGTFGGPDSAAFGLDGDGTVVGFAQDDRWESRAFVVDARDPAAGLTDIGAGNSTAYDVDAGLVVGRFGPGAFAYDLDDPDPTVERVGDGVAIAVDDRLAAGSARVSSGLPHAMAYDLRPPDPTVTDLGTLGGRSWSVGLDRSMVVGGSVTPAGPYHVFAHDLEQQSGIVDLGVLDAARGAIATGISGDLVVGWSYTRRGPDRPTAWRLGTTTTPELRFARLRHVAQEDGSGVEVAVVRVGDMSGAATVDYTTFRSSGSRAMPGADYDPVSGTLSFDPGESRATFSVPITQDDRAETGELIGLALRDPSGGHLGTPQAAAIRIETNDLVADGQVRRRPAVGDYRGDDVYNTTGEGQTARATGLRGTERRYDVRLCSDGNRRSGRLRASPFTVEASSGAPGFRVRYGLGDRDLTEGLTSPDGTTVRVQVDDCKRLSVAVRITRDARPGAVHEATVTMRWTGEGPSTDVVAARTTVRDRP